MVWVRTCEECGDDFIARPSQVRAGFARFCSKACFGKACRTATIVPCGRCGADVRATPSRLKRAHGARLYCSRTCADEGLVVPLMDRIARKTEYGKPAACWMWLGKRHARGYGEITDRGRDLRVTRVLLEAKLGRPLGPGMMALHTCSNPPCVNPAHLFEGTHDTNMVQRKAEGKYATGEAHHMARKRKARKMAHGSPGSEQVDGRAGRPHSE